ncbi:hypothetical protein IGI04_023597 [Brassica rapa subsp. trilocularis]|uniref:Transposase-associated domain-containing protein n=1 Tax=Brassica rapa subsp. trilocularis TaxID=1813537 RepID=A0ABQ7M4C3_BRACM|nr:hypothetical protein IGI04_023597 [Brassica rapa subsp. trilocularis]
MSSSNYFRSWIDRPHLDPNTRLLTEEYQQGITEFMGLVHRQPEAKTGMLRCPCSNCKNKKVIKQWDVWTHLYLSGFTRSYKIWYHHGETDYEHGSTSEPQPAREFGGWMFTYVSDGLARGETFDDWIREMVVGPNFVVKSYPRFCTRGYAFTTQKRRRSSTTYDAVGFDYRFLFLGISSEFSEEIPTKLPISSEFPRKIPRKFRGTWGFKPKTTFYGLNNTYITFIKCLNQIMMFGTRNFGVLSNNKHFYDCMNENHTT